LSTERSSEAVDRLFAALADPKRRRAVELLGARPYSAMSRHLRALKEGGLVEDGHPMFDARVRIYRLKDGATGELKQWLAETEALWSDQLAAFKRHVEGGA